MNRTKMNNRIMPSFLVMILPVLAKNKKVTREIVMKTDAIAKEEN
jgi:hypothetical protein